LGLVSLLALPAELLPLELQSGLDQVLKAVLKMLSAYKEQLDGKYVSNLRYT
jgi:predicted lipid carrier protein YhbT